MDIKNKLRELNQTFESLKEEVASAKGALKNAVENLKKEFGIENEDDALKMIEETQAQINDYKVERDKLLKDIESGLLAIGQSNETLNDIDDFDEFDDFDD